MEEASHSRERRELLIASSLILLGSVTLIAAAIAFGPYAYVGFNAGPDAPTAHSAASQRLLLSSTQENRATGKGRITLGGAQ